MESVSGRLTDFSRNDGANGKTERADLAFTVQNPDLIAPLPGSGDDAQQARKAAQSTDPLSGLLARADAGWGAAFVALLVAAGLGALHGLAPGHGKTVIAAYLVGTKGSRRQAAGLALAVALSHTVGVFALGLVTLAASATLPLERLYTGLRIISAALIIGLGIWLAGRAWFEWRSGKSQRPRLSVGAAVAENRSHDHPHHDDTHHDHAHHDHPHHDDTHHDHAHHDDTHHDQAHHDAGRLHRHGLLPHRHRVAWDNVDLGGAPLSWRALIALGLSGGIVPSASAVIVLLGAVQIGRIPFGAALILAFGVGLSAALVGVGLGVLAISRRTGHLLDATRVGRVIERYTAPLAAAALLSVGVFLLLRALSVF